MSTNHSLDCGSAIPEPGQSPSPPGNRRGFEKAPRTVITRPRYSSSSTSGHYEMVTLGMAVFEVVLKVILYSVLWTVIRADGSICAKRT